MNQSDAADAISKNFRPRQSRSNQLISTRNQSIEKVVLGRIKY